MNKKLKETINDLKAYDLVVIAFFLFLSVLNFIYNNVIADWKYFITANFCIIIFTLAISFLECNFKDFKLWRIIHYWYIAPLIFFTFKELYYMIKPIRIYDYDWLFIKIDRWMFGGDPTVFLAQYSHPLLTEILQIVYGMFYFLPVILAIALIKKSRYLALDYGVFSIIYGFYLSYLGYFILPGIGPRFTLHNFATINNDLPGLWLTAFLRDWTNTGESIYAAMPNAADMVQRDVFPSGHTMITLIVMYLSVRLKSRSKYFLLPVGALLIFSTVYLWYHYVIDLIGGFAFAAFSLWSGKILFNWWRKKTGNEVFEYYKV